MKPPSRGRLIGSLHWRHNDHDGVSNHQPHGCFTQPFIQTQIKETIKAPRHWPLCGEFTGPGEFPTQRASYAENVSIWWRHHVEMADSDGLVWVGTSDGNPFYPFVIDGLNMKLILTKLLNFTTWMKEKTGLNLFIFKAGFGFIVRLQPRGLRIRIRLWYQSGYVMILSPPRSLCHRQVVIHKMCVLDLNRTNSNMATRENILRIWGLTFVRYIIVWGDGNQNIWKVVKFWKGHATFKQTVYLAFLIMGFVVMLSATATPRTLIVNFWSLTT